MSDDHFSGPPIARAAQATNPPLVTSSVNPTGRRAATRREAYSVLLRVGFTVPPRSPSGR